MSIKLAGVLGSPIGHSKSPLIHNYWLKTLKKKGLYVPLDVRPDDFPSFLNMAPRLGFVGFNVTIPHKGMAVEICAELSGAAQRAGSVNTIAFDAEGRALGDSTDGDGFLRNLAQRVGWEPQGKRVAMFGAGGAARAVVAALIDSGAEQVRLTNRSADRAESLKSIFGNRVELAEWGGATGPTGIAAFVDGADLLVNATSLGMSGGPEWTWRLPPLAAAAVATDLIYAPLKTPFLATAEAQGAQIVDGLGMLLHQAAPGFERWFGARPEVTEALRELVLSGEGALP